ncbi:MAG: hypothetical protein WBD75_10610 [Phycisphaerae bacterium]
MKTRYKVLIVLGIVLGVLVAAGIVAVVILSRDEPPPDVADLEVHRVDVADEENGYTYLQEATKVLWWPGYESAVVYAEAGYPDEPEQEEDPVETEKAERLEKIAAGDDWDDALADEVLAHNAETFALIEKALACPHFQVPPVLSIDTMFPEIYDWLSLAKLQAIRARALFNRGREKQAFDEALSIVRMGHTIQGGKGAMIHYLVGSMTKRRGFEITRQMLSATVLDASQLKTCASGLALYAESDDGLAETFRAEFQFCMGTLENLLNSRKAGHDNGQVPEEEQGEVPPSLREQLRQKGATAGLAFKPNETQRLFAEAFRTAIENVPKPYAEVQEIKHPWSEQSGFVRRICSGNIVGKMLCAILLPAQNSAIEAKAQTQTELAATRVLLAMKAFKIKKNGLPQSLDELVPDYLDAVPIDDYDGKPLRYNAEKKVIYSVGKDLKDAGGMTKEEQKTWWLKENPWIEEHPEEEEYNKPDIWQMPDPSFAIEF